MKKKNKAYIIPHTHWDREWRYPIWRNRKLLIEFFNSLLEILDNDAEYSCFLLDGQFSPVEDYLEVCPEDEAKVKKYIREGRVAAGPWYTLPDLYPVSGESLIRNLLKGKKTSERYGNGLKVAYMTFGWGQTAQLPQIYDQFGIDFIICAKKVSKQRAPYAEFLWESPDGTRVITSRLGEYARANLFFNTYIDTRYGVSFLSDDFKYSPSVSGQAIHAASVDKGADDYFLNSPRENWYPEMIKSKMKNSLKATDDTLLPQSRLLLNGCDFSSPQPHLTDFIKEANKQFDDIEFINAKLEDYKNDLLVNVDRTKLPLVVGELRDGPSCDCSGNALSSRIHIKQLNRKAQNMLFRRAEPISVLLSMLGFSTEDRMLEIAEKYLLQSHPHDSINGVTQDKTADDVVYRLNQALEIAEVVYDRCIETLITKLDLSAQNPDDQFIFIFNPNPVPVTGIQEVTIDTFQKDSVWTPGLETLDGQSVLVQQTNRLEMTVPVHDIESRPWPHRIDRHTCFVETGELPACGYTVFRITSEEQFHRDRYYWLPMRMSRGDEISHTDNILENRHLRIKIQPNGTFDLLCKEQGQEYKGLHYFEDSGDVGNYWAYYEPYNNKIYNSTACKAEIALVLNGPLCAEYEIVYHLDIPGTASEPEYGVRGQSARSTETVSLEIKTVLRLTKDSRRLEIKTTLENTCMNHRLRLALPYGIEAEMSAAEGHFTVDERPRVPVTEAATGYYPEMQTLPMQEFVDVSDNEQGVALLSSDFTEFELRNDDNRTLYMTLFRAVNNMIVTGWRAINRFPDQKGSQLQQILEYSYALYPHEGNWKEGGVFYAKDRFCNPPAAYQVSGRSEGNLSSTASLMSIDNPNLILSAVKKSEKGGSWIVRVFNPSNETEEGQITFLKIPTSARYCRIDETKGTAINLEANNSIRCRAGKGKIVTMEMSWEEGQLHD